jgi:hypothetical protein
MQAAVACEQFITQLKNIRQDTYIKPLDQSRDDSRVYRSYDIATQMAGRGARWTPPDVQPVGLDRSSFRIDLVLDLRVLQTRGSGVILAGDASA